MAWKASAPSTLRNTRPRNESHDNRRRRCMMNEEEVRARAFAMPLTNPAFPIGPYRFYHREFLIITYRTDAQKLRALVPAPLQVDEPLVKFEFIRMPDSTGFGDYTESGQVIRSRSRGAAAATPIACSSTTSRRSRAEGNSGAFPKKLANPRLHTEIDTLVGTLDYGPV